MLSFICWGVFRGSHVIEEVSYPHNSSLVNVFNLNDMCISSRPTVFHTFYCSCYFGLFESFQLYEVLLMFFVFCCVSGEYAVHWNRQACTILEERE